VLKIGVIAPFEGIGRELGYAVLPGVREALASVDGERLSGNYRVSVVALNDDLDPLGAAAQARVLAQDRDVLAVIGLWSDATAQFAVPVLEDAEIPTLLATSGSGVGPTTIFLCPAHSRIAEELVLGAQTGPRHIVVTGPDNALQRPSGALRASWFLVRRGHAKPIFRDASSFIRAMRLAPLKHRRWQAAGWNGLFWVVRGSQALVH
jgi:hypothetical protein